MSNFLRYIFDRTRFEQKAIDYSEIGTVYYPLKTNSDPEVIKAIDSLNVEGGHSC